MLSNLSLELARILISTVLASIIVSAWVGYFIKEQGPEFAKMLLKMDGHQFDQLKGAGKRVERTANQMIAKDLMTTTPFAEVVKHLSEETREYLQLHPEALPTVLQNYAGTVDLALNLMPRITEALGIVAKDANTPKYDL